jgi:hypothetical protein
MAHTPMERDRSLWRFFGPSVSYFRFLGSEILDFVSVRNDLQGKFLARIRVAFSFFTVLPAVLAFLGMDRVHISSVSWSGEFSTWKCGVNPSSMICFITQESSNTTFLGFLWGSKLFFVNADHPNK